MVSTTTHAPSRFANHGPFRSAHRAESGAGAGLGRCAATGSVVRRSVARGGEGGGWGCVGNGAAVVVGEYKLQDRQGLRPWLGSGAGSRRIRALHWHLGSNPSEHATTCRSSCRTPWVHSPVVHVVRYLHTTQAHVLALRHARSRQNAALCEYACIGTWSSCAELLAAWFGTVSPLTKT